MDEDRQEQARRNRELMPETARMVDAWRKRFGADTRFVWVCEGSEERGVRIAQHDPRRTMNAEEWLAWVRTGRLPDGKDTPGTR